MRSISRVLRPLIATLLAVVTAATILVTGMVPAWAAGKSLVFATWNVCKIDCDSPAPSWDVRRDRVARVIDQSGVDVLSVNEATDWAYGSRTQWEDIQAITSSAGYVSPRIQDDQCQRRGCTHTARLMFKSSTVRQLDFGTLPSAGYWRVGDIAKNVTFDFDRQVAWAFLAGTNGTGPFFVVGVHLSTDKSAAGEQHRIAFGKAATDWAQAMLASRGMPGSPVILMGDLNSIETRQPNGVQKVLASRGWKDAIDSPKRKNTDINSVNYSDVSRSGWPTRPLRNRYRLASRIDYILFRGPVKATTYEVVAYLNPNGTFNKSYQGSDHQMVRATLAFEGYAPPTFDAATAPAAPTPQGQPGLPSNAAGSTSSSAAAAAAGAGASSDQSLGALHQSQPAGPPFTERQIIARVPYLYRPGVQYVHEQTITARSDGTLVEALLGGVWTPIPYRFVAEHDSLFPDFSRLGLLNLSADPLGGVLPK